MSAIRFEGDSLSNLTETRNATNEVAVQYEGVLSPINTPQSSYLSSYCLLIASASTSSPLQSLLMLPTPVVAVTYVCMTVITISINLRRLSMKGCVLCLKSQTNVGFDCVIARSLKCRLLIIAGSASIDKRQRERGEYEGYAL